MYKNRKFLDNLLYYQLLLSYVNVLTLLLLLQYQKVLRSLLFEVDLLKKCTQTTSLHKKKHMTNRIAGLLQTVFNGDIDKALKVLTFYASLSLNWDKSIPDTKEFYL